MKLDWSCGRPLRGYTDPRWTCRSLDDMSLVRHVTACAKLRCPASDNVDGHVQNKEKKGYRELITGDVYQVILHIVQGSEARRIARTSGTHRPPKNWRAAPKFLNALMAAHRYLLFLLHGRTHNLLVLCRRSQCGSSSDPSLEEVLQLAEPHPTLSQPSLRSAVPYPPFSAPFAQSTPVNHPHPKTSLVASPASNSSHVPPPQPTNPQHNVFRDRENHGSLFEILDCPSQSRVH